jgi:hypothetical protein
MSRWTSWLGAVLIALSCGLAPLRAQTAPTTTGAPAEKPSALPYAVAAGMAIVVLLIVCMPSRKGQ